MTYDGEYDQYFCDACGQSSGTSFLPGWIYFEKLDDQAQPIYAFDLCSDGCMIEKLEEITELIGE